MKDVKIGGLTISNDRPLLVIAGPCQLESLTHAQMIAGHMAEVCAAAGAQYVFKASYDKANRTSLKGRRGLGMDEGLKVLEAVGSMGMPVLTDIHDIAQARIAAKVVDVIQIPAFLCRQTDLLLAAGETGAVINIKKGQFLAPEGMANVAAKVASTGNENILLTERGVAHRVLVIGDGPARAWFAERLPQARFVGQQVGTDLARALASTDIFLNPSVTEAFGNVTLEAMASGLPVVAAAATGANSIVQDGDSGTLVEPGEIEQYADALEAYVRDAALRRNHGDHGLAHARTQDWTVINAAVEAAYYRVIERRARIARALGR